MTLFRRAVRLAVFAVLSNVISCSSDASSTEIQELVNSVVVSLGLQTLTVGQTVQAGAIAHDGAGSTLNGVTITWSSSDPSVASISAAGLVTAIAPGTTQITGAVGTRSASTTVTVTGAPVAAVTVALSPAAVVVGQPVTATATALDANNTVLTGRPVTWSSSNPNVATVSSSGAVSVIGPGAADIIATSEGAIGKATLTVQSPAIGSVSVSLSSTSLAPGQTTTATAVVRDSAATVVTGLPIAWSSSDNTVATVNSEGLVTAVSAGAATITATTGGVGGTAALTVQSVAGSVTVSLTDNPLTVGKTTTATATVRDGSGNTMSGQTVTWSSNTTGVATVSSTGVITSVAVGTATITATSNGLSGAAVIAVQPAASSMTVALGVSSLKVGLATTATATVLDAGGATLAGRTVTWTSSDVNVAAVSASGIVTGLAAGSATIIGTVDAASGNAPVTVTTTGGGTPTATQLAVTTQPSATAQSGVALGQQPSVQLRDALNNAIGQAGVVVSAVIASGSGTLGGTTSATTDGSGVATFSNLSITGSGSNSLRFSAPALTPTTSNAIAVAGPPPPPPTATQLSITTQPSASAQNGVAFGQQPAIQLRSSSNGAISSPGVVVAATIITGSGTLGGTTTATTDVSGVATFTNLVITGPTGTRTLRFTSSGLSSTTSSGVAVTAGAATRLVVATQPSTSAQTGTAFAQQPAIQVADASGNAVSSAGVVVTVAVASGSGTLGGTATATTGSNGAAVFAGLNITGSGAHTLQFTASGLSSATSGAISVGAIAATKLTIATQPSTSTTSGAAFAQQPAIQLSDATDSPVGQGGVVVTTTVASGSGALGGTATATTNAAGLATFANLLITGSGTHTLRFAATGLSSTTSSSIAVSTNAATKLAITTQPSNTPQSGVAFSQQPVIQLQTSVGNPVSQAGTVVTATISSGGGTLGGTTTATTDASGAAAFTNLSISGTAGARTLRFTSTGLSSVSAASVTLLPGAATQLAITVQPSTSVASGAPFAQQPAVQIRDASNNAIVQAGVVVTATVASGSGVLGGTATATTNTSGIATFTNLKITGSGAHTLSFTAPSLTAATSGSIGVSGAATHLTITTQPSTSILSGLVLGQQPVLQLRDAAEAPVGQSGVVVTAGIASGIAVLGGTATATTNASGVATFTNLIVTALDGVGLTLNFAAPSLGSVTSGSATVSLAAAPSGSCPNEPAGFTTISDQPWDQSPARSVRAPLGWVDDAGNGASALSIVTDATSPYQSANHNVIDGLFPAGMPGGGAPFYVYRPFSAVEQFKNLYICVYLKHDANFDNTNGNAGTKFLWPAGDQVQGSQTYLSHDGPDMEFMVIQQGGVDRQLRANLSAPAALMAQYRGQWVRYELEFKSNTSNGAADGALNVWINGTKTHQYTNVNWQMAAARTWLSLAWNPTYGGGTHPVPHNQHQYMDHIHISGSP
ncbi:MAG TPA: Ig-like domain-containing protein [Gemmatimonadaceae bacterium]|nr:Ig-like domain-containing protein [Gemmatimonadaceae bacterium]